MNTSNTRTAALFVLALFFIWGVISWYWYTCSIKGFCSSEQPVQEEPLPESVLPVVDKPVVVPPLFDKLPTLPSCAPYITHAVTAKGPNRRSDVVKVQLFLNKFHFQKNILPANGVYGPRTIAAVKDFQWRYGQDILAPYKLRYPTGNVTKRTMEKMNEIVCGSPDKF
jgi:hypothetical protein